jgi:polysaccharide biosynthesis protein PelD
MSADAIPSSQTVARILGLRRWAVAEVLVFLAAALLADTTFGAGTRFVGVVPHPFWAIVIIVAAQYGTLEGLFAWAAATAALLVGNLPPHSVGQDLQLWLPGVVSLPAGWLGTCLVLGALTDRHRSAILRFEGALAAAREREGKLVTSLEQLTELRDSLETAIAGELHTASAVVAGARAITRLDTSQVVLGVGPLVSSILKPEKFSVFLLQGTQLESVLKVGWVREDHWMRGFSADTALFQAIVGRRRILTVARSADEKVLLNQGVLAGPLLAADTGEVFGMLKIEQLRFASLTPATMHTFRVLCEWIGEAYRNARRHEETVQAPARPYEGTSLASFSETGVFKAEA